MSEEVYVCKCGNNAWAIHSVEKIECLKCGQCYQISEAEVFITCAQKFNENQNLYEIRD